MADKILDAKGLTCPMPVLKARKMLQGMGKGEVLEIHSTDPSSITDFEAFCEHTRYTLLAQSLVDGVYTFQIRNTS